VWVGAAGAPPPPPPPPPPHTPTHTHTHTPTQTTLQGDGKGDYDTNIQNMYNFMNSVKGIQSTECTSKLGYKCLFAQHLFPYIKNNFMALNSAYDATMGNGECGAGSGIILNWSNPVTVNACGNHVRSQFRQLLMGERCLALPACLCACLPACLSKLPDLLVCMWATMPTLSVGR
jgi:hypothetical protein